MILSPSIAVHILLNTFSIPLYITEWHPSFDRQPDFIPNSSHCPAFWPIPHKAFTAAPSKYTALPVTLPLENSSILVIVLSDATELFQASVAPIDTFLPTYILLEFATIILLTLFSAIKAFWLNHSDTPLPSLLWEL